MVSIRWSYGNASAHGRGSVVVVNKKESEKSEKNLRAGLVAAYTRGTVW